MRNTLLGQCFHTRNEKSHKDIFDLFQPFLQSLEALQDGEHEKQRRHFLYFLLHQVSVSGNFSVLTRQKARQIALLIVHRGYAMNPPCPPFECAHMWGPSLVLSLKDSSLHNSLRQPAFDLIQTIMVSDAACLASSILSCCPPLSIERRMSSELNCDEDDEDNGRPPSFAVDAEEKDDSCWKDFSKQSKITSLEFREWMCIPMLWIDVLIDINPSVLPISFSKAVFWARTRFSMVDPESSSEMAIPVRTWLSSSATDISTTFGWKVPTGSDDGGDGKESKNSIKVSTMSLPLIRTFNRLTAYFIVQVGQGELRKQWTWEPRMGESLILSLLDPNDTVRQFGKCILEQVSNTRGLACGLKFLCSYGSSLFAILLGLRHAVRLVQLDTVLSKFQTLHHFFFILRKLLMEEDLPTSVPDESSDHLSTSKFSSEGGFLRQPVFDSLTANINRHSADVDLKLHKKFCYILSETAWPSIRRCLIEGKAFIDYNISQMTCVRLLEILPAVFERLYPLFIKQHGFSGIVKSACDFSWLHDLVDWGKSSLKVVVVYWKRTFTALLKLLKESCSSNAASTIMTIENLISCDGFSLDQLMEQVSCLAVSLSKEASNIGKNNFSSKTLFPGGLKNSVSDVQPLSIEDLNVEILDPATMDDKKDRENLIVLSDDEKEQMDTPSEFILSDKTSQCMLDVETVASGVDDVTLLPDYVKKKVHGTDTSKDILEAFKRRDAKSGSGFTSRKEDNDNSRGKSPSIAPSVPEGVRSKQKEISPKSISGSFRSQASLKILSNEAVSIKKMNKARDNAILKAGEAMLRKIVCDAEDDPLEAALDSVGQKPPQMAKPSISVPKRQLIQLKTPIENRFGHLQRLEARAKRFKPPKLDAWYRPILEIDYFATVGLSAASEDDSRIVCKLKEVPVSFQSPEQYIEIFRPLVLEEFKAQLQNSFLEMSSLEDMYFGCFSVLSVERIDDFHLVRFAQDDKDSTSSRSFSENDLVLLTKEPLQRPSHDVHMVGKVEKRERDHKRRLSILLIRFYLQNGTSRLNLARRNLLERSKWHASQIMSITPQVREFQALSSIKDIPLFPIILKPDNDSCGRNEYKELDLSKLAQPLQKILKSSFNDSQLQAISIAIGPRNSNKTFDLSLIQGPPGTGKTRTILAIASGLLASQKTNHARNPIDGSGKQNRTSVLKISQTAAIARAWQDAALARQLNEDVQNHPKSMENTARGRILICAQSNAAVDELVSRISSHGLHGSDGKMYKPYLVRVGNVKTVHSNSLPFFIDTLVDQRLADEKTKLNDGKNDLSVNSSVELRSNLEKLVDRIRFYEAKRANLSDGNSDLKKSLEDDSLKGDNVKEMSDADIGLKLRKLYEQKKQIYKDLSSVQALEKKTNEEIKGLKYKLRKSILREAEIVVATLSGCGGDLYGVCSESMSNHKFGSPSEHILFDAVVIDEAAQALEPATLIPLQLLKSSGTKCIMVGDPKQLPATVLSNVASRYFYECSMFERLQRAGHPVVMLTKQYRMHPEICRFPSFHFYERKLLNGDQMSSKSAPFHETEGLGPYVFYDIIDGQERRGKNSGSLSLYNEHEADAAVEVLKFFKKRHPSEFVGGRIGIITPYKSQLSLLRSRFSSAFGSSVIDEMEFNTVDGFQGREVDILILSTVRAAESSFAPGIKSSNIGFVADVRRMNVALTRAKLSLWIMGNSRTLQTNQNWAALVQDAKERKLVITVKMPYGSMFKSANWRNPAAETSENYSTKKRTERSENEASDQKTNIHHVSKRRREGDAKDFSTSREDCRVNKRNARGKADLLVKDLPSVVVKDGNKGSKEGTSLVSGKNVTEGKIKGKESSGRKMKFENSPMDTRKIKENSSKNMDNIEQGMDESHKSLSSKVSKRMKGSSGGDDRSHRNLEVSTPSAVSSLEERDSSGKERAQNQVGTSKDLIAKRKQQREAVDAILYSALIPSKKADTSAKSVPSKKPPPSSTASGKMKPPHKRKD